MKIKILFLIPTLDNGGAEKCLINMINNFDFNKYDITVKTMYNTGENRKYLNSKVKYTFVFKKYPKGFIHIYKLFSPKFLFKFFIKKDYDVIVSYLEGPTTRIASGCNSKNTKLINWIHCDLKDVKQFCNPYRSIEEMKRVYRKYNFTIFVSTATRNNFISMFPNEFKNSIVIHNVIDTEGIINCSNEKIDLNKKGITLVTVGRLAKVKGYDRLIKTVDKLISNGVECYLWIIGNGPEEKNLKQYIDNNNLNDYIHLTGYEANPYKYLEKGDIYVCSSYSEAYSTSVTESIVLGKPVVTTLCSGMNEILENGKSGLIVNNDDDSLYLGLKKMITDENYRNKFIKASKMRFKDLKINNQMKTIEQFFDSLVE